MTWLSSSSLDEELSYFVHYRRTNTTNISSIMSWPNVTAKMQFSFAILDGLKPFTNYSIVVIARTPCGSSNMAEVEVVTTKGPPPGALQNVSIAAILPTVVRVKWEKPDGVVTGYKVNTTLQYTVHPPIHTPFNTPIQPPLHTPIHPHTYTYYTHTCMHMHKDIHIHKAGHFERPWP